MSENRPILGVDVGASGIKGTLVDLQSGTLLGSRHRIPMPKDTSPDVVAGLFRDLVTHFDYSGPIGCGFPAVIKQGVAHTAANLNKSWIGTDAAAVLTAAADNPVYVVNDADAAGVAEMTFGAGRDERGVVVLITIGTGLGTAVFLDGRLLPNTELGHIYLASGVEAERHAANSTKKREELTWKQWGKRFNEYLRTMDDLLRPDLFILGGGSSKNFAEYAEFLKVRCRVVPAQMQNAAGIVGAAQFGAIMHAEQP